MLDRSDGHSEATSRQALTLIRAHHNRYTVMAEAGTGEAEADAPKSVSPPMPCPRKNYKPLSEEETASLFDSDGRLVRENKLRQALFEGTTRR